MFGAATMTAFTPDAEARLGDYLRQVRAALADAPGVDPAEVEADIRDHVGAEFAGAAGPVSAADLAAVLARLGPPGQWAGGAGRAVEPIDWGRTLADLRRRVLGVFATLYRGPEDWRLAYLAFAVTVLAVPTVGFLLPVAFLLSRAAVEVCRDKGLSLGARRWLVYPAILLVSGPVLVGLLAGPGVGAGVVAFGNVGAAQFRIEVDGKPRVMTVVDVRGGRPGIAGEVVIPASDVSAERRVLAAVPGPRVTVHWVAGVFTAAGATAGWWAVLGAVGWAAPGLPRVALHPFADGWTGRRGRGMLVWGGAVFLLWAAVLYRWLEAAGVV